MTVGGRAPKRRGELRDQPRRARRFPAASCGHPAERRAGYPSHRRGTLHTTLVILERPSPVRSRHVPAALVHAGRRAPADGESVRRRRRPRRPRPVRGLAAVDLPRRRGRPAHLAGLAAGSRHGGATGVATAGAVRDRVGGVGGHSRDGGLPRTPAGRDVRRAGRPLHDGRPGPALAAARDAGGLGDRGHRHHAAQGGHPALRVRLPPAVHRLRLRARVARPHPARLHRGVGGPGAAPGAGARRRHRAGHRSGTGPDRPGHARHPRPRGEPHGRPGGGRSRRGAQ